MTTSNVWDAEWEVSEALARQLIDQQFPKLSSLPLSWLGSGWDNTVYLVGERYAFRFPRRTVAVKLMKNETKILPLLENYVTLPYTKPLFHGKESDEYPFPFMGCTYLKGESPVNLSDEARMKSAADLGLFLKGLHSFPLSVAEEAGVMRDHRKLTDVALRRQKMQVFLEKLENLLPAADTETLREYLEQLTIESVRPRYVLLHGDLHYKNMLVDSSGNITGIIDWGDMNLGHPACDLSLAYSYLPPGARDIFFLAYGGADEETKALARLIAIYIPMLLLIQASDSNDPRTFKEASSIIKRALTD